MKSKGIPPIVWAILATALGVAVVWLVDDEVAQRHVNEQRAQVADKVSALRAELQATLNSRLSLVEGLAAFVKSGEELAHGSNKQFGEQFNAYTDELLKGVGGIRSLQLAPDGVVTNINPLKGNEAALGHDLMADPARREAAERAIREKQFVVAGPVELRQGGVALIGRLPIFLPSPDEEKTDRFWGFSIILIDLPPLLTEAGLSEQASGLKFALRGKDGLGAQGAVFFGDGAIFDAGSVVQDVILPNGSWQMAALPVEGWRHGAEEQFNLRAFGGTMSVVFGGLIFVLLFGREKLATNEQRLSSAFEAIDEGIWDWNIVTGEIDFSPSWPKIFGYTLDEIDHHVDTWESWVHPDDKAEVMKTLNDHLEGRTPYYVSEHRMKNKGGAWLWILSRGKVIEWDNGGKPIRMVGADLDITERKRAEQALRESEDRLRRSVLDAPIPIMIHAEDGEVLMINHEWTSLTGYTHAEIPTIPVWTELAYGSRGIADQSRERIGSLYDIEEKKSEGDCHITTKTGEPRIWDFRSSPLGKLPDGRRFVISMAVDVTERRMAHDELERRVDERTAELRAAQAGLLRQERLATLGQLTATVSHELRNPLGVIQTSTFVVRDNLKDCDPRVGRSLERIERSVIRCDRIIEELLDYTRIRQLEPEPTPIDPWLEGVLEEQTQHTDISLRCEFGLPGVKVFLDQERFRRAVINVFENACQAMVGDDNGKIEEGEHILTIQTSKSNGRIEVVFEDNGPGIPPDVLPKIFEPMFSTKGFGVGLGLPVVKQIMEQHGGGIEIDSGQGRGTRTCLWLPSDHAVH